MPGGPAPEAGAQAAVNHAPLAVATRNGHVERWHSGSVAVVDAAGHLLAYAGDPASYTFSRSTLKPFQALPFVRSGGIEHFGFAPHQVALLCASHAGQDMHVAAVSDMLEKIGCTEHDLGCGCHLPQQYQDGALPPADFKLDQRHNNCSGKHAGFLGFCRLHGLPTQNYLDPSHALQRAVLETVATLADMDTASLWQGTDGCNAPNWGMPLARLARLWARLAGARAAADSNGSEGDDGQAALATLADAMMTYPDMYSGTGRADSALTRAGAGRWVAKTGADGVRCVGVRGQGLGIAVKIADGNAQAACAVTIEVLRQLGLVEASMQQALQAWAQPALHNCIGREVGDLQCRLELSFI